MFNWFKKEKVPASVTPLRVDMHSHLLPGLDDGVGSFEESEHIIRQFMALGYSKLITTPHIMSDMYPNTRESILQKLAELKDYLAQKNITIALEAAAEYYLDEALLHAVEQDSPLLTFGQHHILFETNFLNEPFQLKEFIFSLSTKGYTPVLAHPERYIYLQNDLAKLEDLLNRGVLFQINTSSLSGYYSKGAQHTAFQLIDRGWVHFLGSDCHSSQHIQLLADAQTTRYFQKALTLPLLNNTL